MYHAHLSSLLFPWTLKLVILCNEYFAAIIELFHLLPSAAGKFLDELVTLTIDLEAALPSGQFYSEINSPYRLPLTKFLNRYPAATVDYFLARLCQPKYFRR
jgi:transformation/transcription domain-associated protein